MREDDGGFTANPRAEEFDLVFDFPGSVANVASRSPDMTATTPQLEGRWQLVHAHYAGEQAPELVTQKTQVEFDGARYRVRYAGEIVDHGTYEIAVTQLMRTMIL